MNNDVRYNIMVPKNSNVLRGLITLDMKCTKSKTDKIQLLTTYMQTKRFINMISIDIMNEHNEWEKLNIRDMRRFEEIVSAKADITQEPYIEPVKDKQNNDINFDNDNQSIHEITFGKCLKAEEIPVSKPKYNNFDECVEENPIECDPQESDTDNDSEKVEQPSDDVVEEEEVPPVITISTQNNHKNNDYRNKGKNNNGKNNRR